MIQHTHGRCDTRRLKFFIFNKRDGGGAGSRNDKISKAKNDSNFNKLNN